MDRILIALLLVFVFNACKKKDNFQTSSFYNTSQYLLEHVPDEISVKDDIYLRFKREIPEKVRQDIGKYISIKPKIDVTYEFRSNQQLIIKPNKQLPHNKAYTLSFDPKKLFDLDEGDPVNIAFATKGLKFLLDLKPIVHDYDGQKEISYLEGSIESNDHFYFNEVKSMLSTNQKNNDELAIAWGSNTDGTLFPFTIKGIKKFNKDSDLKIEVDGRKWDKLFKREEVIKIQPEGDFSVSQVNNINAKQKYISVVFSESLKKDQNLKGLITTNVPKISFKTEIDNNELRLYPETPLTANFELSISAKIKNKKGDTLGEKYNESLSMILENPEVRLLGSGVVTPIKDEVVFPFEARNLNKVDVEIFKIYENNVLQFLQYNALDGNGGLYQVGKVVFQDSIPLNRTGNNLWESFYIDLRKMVDLDPAAIYQVRIGFKQQYAVLNCENDIQSVTIEKDGTQSIMETYNSYYEGYEYKHRKDPCYPAYYAAHQFKSRNLLPSNLGIITKLGEKNKLTISITDLNTTDILNGVRVTAYDYQQQKLGQATSSSGQVEMLLNEQASFIVAEYNNQYGYLNLQDYYANPLTEFEVQGKVKTGAIDGFIYGERGVWRPGDTLFLSFMLEDKENRLPKNHPVSFLLKDSRGSKKYEEKTSENLGGLYVFKVPTDANDPTGNWACSVSIGPQTFRKTLKVETIKPNRLKIALGVDPKEEVDLSKSNEKSIPLQSNWLHGAPAKNLRAKVELQYVHRPVRFKSFDNYVFNDYDKIVDNQVQTIFDGQLNEDGLTKIKFQKPSNNTIAGKLRANVKTRVFENGGNASEDNFSVDINPFNSYAGLSLPKSNWGSTRYGLGSTQTIKAINLDQNAQPVTNKKLHVGIYRSSKYWWYRRNAQNRFNYANGKHIGADKEMTLITDNKGMISFDENMKDAGSYYVRICDTESGHCTGDYYYVRGRYNDISFEDVDKSQLSKLFLQADKSEYLTGDVAKITIPSSPNTKILVSVESQHEVIYQEWIPAKSDQTEYQLTCLPEMAPNVYVHVSMIQKHAQEQNDLPMRMYGVIPIKVKDENTLLQPRINMPKKLEPLEHYTINVSETSGKEMHYTLAVVDEGLLDITRFKTPDAWNHFYAKQSLLLKTWDNYDYILNGYGTHLNKVLSVGGDGENEAGSGPKKANRFKPVVSFLGPFTLQAGKENSHQLKMDNYIGSVKVMLVARNKDAYGKDHKVVPVKKPLMLLATAPRVIGPQEQFTLPVNVFAMEDEIRNVDVKLELSDNISILDSKDKTISFNKVGDQIVNFSLQAKDLIDIGKIRVSGTSGKHKIDQEIEIDIRNPNPYISYIVEAVIEPKQNWKSAISKLGVEGTNEAMIEVSHFPAMNVEDRMDYLIRYPYGCLEQTTSSVFPQLYMENVVELSEERKAQIKHNIEEGIRRLKNFQRPNGALSYWPGSSRYADWSQTYALHFLIEAKNKGYYVPLSFIDDITNHAAKYARNFDVDEIIAQRNNYYHYYKSTSYRRSLLLCQAYRLYILALVNKAELSAMNILREESNMPAQAQLLLAAAYSMLGKKNVADEISSRHEIIRDDTHNYYYCYGSWLRTQAVACLAYESMNKRDQAGKLAFDIAKSLGQNKWYSTQSIAFSMLAVGKFLGTSERSDLNFDLQTANASAPNTVSTNKPIFLYKLSETEHNSGEVSLVNNTNDVMYARLITSGQPAVAENISYDKVIKMDVRYLDENGRSIQPDDIKQGTDFEAVVNIYNTTENYLTNMALAQIFPSGWEVQNFRMSSLTDTDQKSSFEYQDIRDDRVYTFFNLGPKKSKAIHVKLNASYVGEYFLPDVFCEAMYDHDVQARVAGQKVKVTSTQ